MITNIIGIITTIIITNAYHPIITAPTVVCAVSTPYNYFPQFEPEVREDPDVQIVEIRKIRTLTFKCEGKPFALELENTLLQTTRYRKKPEIREWWEIKEIPGPDESTITSIHI